MAPPVARPNVPVPADSASHGDIGDDSKLADVLLVFIFQAYMRRNLTYPPFATGIPLGHKTEPVAVEVIVTVVAGGIPTPKDAASPRSNNGDAVVVIVCAGFMDVNVDMEIDTDVTVTEFTLSTSTVVASVTVCACFVSIEVSIIVTFSRLVTVASLGWPVGWTRSKSGVAISVTVSVSVRLSVLVRLRVRVTGGGADAIEVIVLVVVDNMLSTAGHVRELLTHEPPPPMMIELRVAGLSVHIP